MGGTALHSSMSKERLFIVYDDGTNKIKASKKGINKNSNVTRSCMAPLLELINFTSL